MATQGTIEIRYRPAVDVENADDLVDVQELLLVLEEQDGPVRLAEIGRKRLPPPDDGGASPNWGHVRRVVAEREELDDHQLLDQLGIEEEASYGINVKDPRAGGDTGLEDPERARYPDDLQAVFDGNRWSGADPIELLDHEGAEFLLIPSGEAAE